VFLSLFVFLIHVAASELHFEVELNLADQFNSVQFGDMKTALLFALAMHIHCGPFNSVQFGDVKAALQ